jgi:hypothetical protein
MDLWKALRELHQERERLNALIAHLEALKRGSKPGKSPRRGRKSMPPEERQVVSERMRAYWARRKQTGSGTRMASA